jgi:hypothetical protein
MNRISFLVPVDVLHGDRFPVLQDQGKRAGMVCVLTGVVLAVGDLVAVLSHDFTRITVPEGFGTGSVRMLNDEVLAYDEYLVEQGVEDMFEFMLFEGHVSVRLMMSEARSLTNGEWFGPTKVSSIFLKSNWAS